MTELDDAVEKLRQADEARRTSADQVMHEMYGLGGEFFPPSTSLSPMVADFCSRLTDYDGTPWLAVEWERGTLFAAIPDSSFADRMGWSKVYRTQYRNLRRDGVPARRLVLSDPDMWWTFYGVVGGTWFTKHRFSPGEDLQRAMVAYLANKPR